MPFQQSTGQLRTPVSTYTNLPLTANVKGDVRIVVDTGTAYSWISESTSGTWVDWKKVTVSNYADLVNKPSSSTLAIDTASQMIRNIYLNYVYLFFMNIAAMSMNVLKMFDGVLDTLVTEDGIDLVRTSNQKRLIVPTMNNYASYYINDFDDSLDSYTRLLIQGKNINVETTDFFDVLLNDILRNDTDENIVITKFGIKSLKFDGASNSYLLLNSFLNNPTLGFSNDGNPLKVEGVDFTWDFWVRCDSDAAETIIVDHQFNHTDGGCFKIEKLADKTIKASLLGCTGYYFDMQTYPENPVEYNVAGATTIEKETWNHIALVRQSGYLKLYINGVLDGTSAVANNHLICDYNNEMVIGNEGGLCLGKGFTGCIEEVRFSKGIARYTATFTPRTVPYNNPIQSAPCNNMVIQSNAYETNTVPTSARIVIFEQDGVISYNPKVVQNVIPNTDIKVYISRDAGATFTQVTDLKVEMDVNQEVVWTSLYSNVNFLVGTVDLSSQPTGKSIVFKITTHNNKDLLIRSIALNWK